VKRLGGTCYGTENTRYNGRETINDRLLERLGKSKALPTGQTEWESSNTYTVKLAVKKSRSSTLLSEPDRKALGRLRAKAKELDNRHL
jgi:hypothetical protein